MLRQELQSYFDRVYPYSKIDTELTLGGQVHIRFELGGEQLENGTTERVNQATDRALTIFNETFIDTTQEIFVLIYEYQGENIFNASNDYLHKQFPADRFEKFYNQLETVNTRYFTTDENGNDVLDNLQAAHFLCNCTKQDLVLAEEKMFSLREKISTLIGEK